MTRRRNDGHSTEFGLWLRDQAEIASSEGFLATNLDFIWTNYETGKWMLIEEKRFMSPMKKWQREIFDRLDAISKSSPLYCGFAFIQFENSSPNDGKTFWNGEEITRKQLIQRLSIVGIRDEENEPMSNEKHQITGRIHAIMETQTFASGFQKREFVVKAGTEKYPQEIKLESVRDKCDELDSFGIGETVNVSFDIRGNEYNGRHYVNLVAWKIERTGGAPREVQTEDPRLAGEAEPERHDQDDIPF